MSEKELNKSNTAADWPPVWLPRLIKKTYEVYESFQRQWTETYRRDGGIIYCQPGCSYCCNMSLRITLLEAIYLNQNLTRGQRKRVIAHSRRVLSFAEPSQDDDDYFYQFRASIGECPFLDGSGECTVYPFRPMPCRQTCSSLPGLFCRYDIMDTVDNGELDRVIASLDPEINRSTPYIFPLIKRGESLEKHFQQEMKNRLGFSIEGEMSVLIDFLEQEPFQSAIRTSERSSLRSIITSIADPRLIIIESD